MRSRKPTRTREQNLGDPIGIKNANVQACENLSKLEFFALRITDKVGSPGFFLLIFTWTILWTGYNILASKVPSLYWNAFDPFPAFVAYLLISNVIQILLMPLILIGQNLQSRHAEIRAENDYEVNVKAESEIAALAAQVAKQQELLENILKKLTSASDPEIAGQEVPVDQNQTT